MESRFGGVPSSVVSHVPNIVIDEVLDEDGFHLAVSGGLIIASQGNDLVFEKVVALLPTKSLTPSSSHFLVPVSSIMMEWFRALPYFSSVSLKVPHLSRYCD